MRELVLKMSISADGFVAGPNGEIDWIFKTMDSSGSKWIEQTLWEAGVHIMGSRTFHDMANYWPTSTDLLAAPMNEIPKVVFSKRGFIENTSEQLATQALRDARRIDAEKGIATVTNDSKMDSWKNARVEKDLVSGVNELKRQDGKFILAHGGASFAQDLVKNNLIDEYRLVIHPVILGKGLPLFAHAQKPIYLKLKSSQALASGIIVNVYSV